MATNKPISPRENPVRTAPSASAHTGSSKAQAAPGYLFTDSNFLMQLDSLAAPEQARLLGPLENLHQQFVQAVVDNAAQRRKILESLGPYLSATARHEDSCLHAQEEVMKALILASMLPAGPQKDKAYREAAGFMQDATEHSKKARAHQVKVDRCKDALETLNRDAVMHMKRWSEGIHTQIMGVLQNPTVGGPLCPEHSTDQVSQGGDGWGSPKESTVLDQLALLTLNQADQTKTMEDEGKAQLQMPNQPSLGGVTSTTKHLAYGLDSETANDGVEHKATYEQDGENTTGTHTKYGDTDKTWHAANTINQYDAPRPKNRTYRGRGRWHKKRENADQGEEPTTSSIDTTQGSGRGRGKGKGPRNTRGRGWGHHRGQSSEGGAQV